MGNSQSVSSGRSPEYANVFSAFLWLNLPVSFSFKCLSSQGLAVWIVKLLENLTWLTGNWLLSSKKEMSGAGFCGMLISSHSGPYLTSVLVSTFPNGTLQLNVTHFNPFFSFWCEVTALTYFHCGAVSLSRSYRLGRCFTPSQTSSH